MANIKVSLLRYVKTDRGWRRFRVSEEATRKGRGWSVDWDSLKSYGPGATELGDYQLKWYEGSKAQYAGVGRDLREAVTKRDKRASLLEAEDAAGRAGATLVPQNPDRKSLDEQGAAFVRLKELAGMGSKTIQQYGNLIPEFIQVSGKRYADQVTQMDLLEFCDALRKRGLSERTTMNYYSAIASFLFYCEVDHKKLVAKDHRPHVVDPDPEAYSEEEVLKFMAALTNDRHRLYFEFLLKTGVREGEASYLEWADITWADKIVTIQGDKVMHLVVNGKEKSVRFRTKTRRSREIPLEAKLLANLQAWRKKNPTSRFPFGTRSDLPDGHMLDVVKSTSYRAGLNCQMCSSCRKTKGQFCERCYLHKWRSTFATWSLRAGVDIRSVQSMLGHTKIEMTARYLAAARGKAAQAQINSVFAGF
jgi:integrase